MYSQKGGRRMSQATNYDVIVIGTSQGGRLLPGAFAKAGRKVAVVERGHLGGVCVNAGCTPTKTMVASARVAYLAKRGAEYGASLASGSRLRQQRQFFRRQQRSRQS